jgi:hypothetical protein
MSTPMYCMKVELQRENYQAYVECKDIRDTQQLIFHKLSGEQGDRPKTTPAIAS